MDKSAITKEEQQFLLSEIIKIPPLVWLREHPERTKAWWEVGEYYQKISTRLQIYFADTPPEIEQEANPKDEEYYEASALTYVNLYLLLRKIWNSHMLPFLEQLKANLGVNILETIPSPQHYMMLVLLEDAWTMMLENSEPCDVTPRSIYEMMGLEQWARAGDILRKQELSKKEERKLTKLRRYQNRVLSWTEDHPFRENLMRVVIKAADGDAIAKILLNQYQNSRNEASKLIKDNWRKSF